MTREIDPALADSEAAGMLSAALAKASNERGLSLRKIAPLVGYKQAVVLSHMATGRIPIPFEKAERIAEVLGMSASDFLKAILKQRHPDVSWSLITDFEGGLSGDFVEGLVQGLGEQKGRLNQEQLAVINEIVVDPHPRRRWLSVEEAAALEMLRAAGSKDEVISKPARDYAQIRTERPNRPE